MHFLIDYDVLAGMSSDGLYAIRWRDERFGNFLDISYDGALAQTVWVRETDRPVLPHELRIAGDADTVVEWVVDNGAHTGADHLLTLDDPVGTTSLGELLQAFCEAWETSRAQHNHDLGRPWPLRLVRVGCRGNQRAMMAKQYGP